MLTAHYLKKSFDSQLLFEKISFSLNPGERIGLIGPNGCGKTTLLRILIGAEPPTEGYITRRPGLRLGYLPQGLEVDPAARVGEIIGKAAGSAAELEAELSAAAVALTLDPKDSSLEAAYEDVLRRMEYAETGKAGSILAGLGLNGVDPDMPVDLLSGGQKTRLALALVLLKDPQILLLDEPTNHLDIRMLEWLEEWLNACPCGALIISHDRTFLDHTVTRIFEMDPLHRSLREYAGNYSDYLAQRQAEIDKQWSAYHDQEETIRRMRADIARVKAQAAYTERQASSIRIGGPDMKMKGFKSYQQGIAKKVAKKAVAREKKLERYIEDEERVERPQNGWQMRLDFTTTPHLGKSVVQLENVSIGYYKDAPLLEGVELSVPAGRRIAITGPNGSGKTTLLNTIAGHLPPLAGEVHLGSSVRPGVMSQDQSGLDPKRTALDLILPEFINQTEARNFLAKFLFTGDEPLKPIGLLSFGQRARLMLAQLVAGKVNLLLLDEPINHLDIPSRTQFEQALRSFNGAVLAVVHDRYFIERFAEDLWWVQDGRIKVISCELPPKV